MLLCVAGVDVADDAQLPTEDCSGDGSSHLTSDVVFEAIAATLPDAGSADELRERSEPGHLLAKIKIINKYLANRPYCDPW